MGMEIIDSGEVCKGERFSAMGPVLTHPDRVFTVYQKGGNSSLFLDENGQGDSFNILIHGIDKVVIYPTVITP